MVSYEFLSSIRDKLFLSKILCQPTPMVEDLNPFLRSADQERPRSVDIPYKSEPIPTSQLWSQQRIPRDLLKESTATERGRSNVSHLMPESPRRRSYSPRLRERLYIQESGQERYNGQHPKVLTRPRSCSPALYQRNTPRFVKPYYPTMKAYGPGNITAYIDQCKTWDKIDEDVFEVDLGEKVKMRNLKKIFDKDHYIKLEEIYVNNELISQQQTLRRGRSSSSGSYGHYDKSSQNKVILAKISKHQREKRRINELWPILDMFFSTQYRFPIFECDPIMSLEIANMVSFGDLKDAQNTKPDISIPFPSDIQYLGTVRPFQPGTYYVTVIQPIASSDPLVMYHHADLDAAKIMKKIVLMAEDYCDYHGGDISNSLDSYDWCEWRNSAPSDEQGAQGKEDSQQSGSDLSQEPNIIYFGNTNKMKNLEKSVKKGNVYQSQKIPDVFQILDEYKNCIALGTNMKQYNSGEWLYAKLFEDRENGRNFALVVNCILGEFDAHFGGIPDSIIKRLPDRNFTTVKETKLKFDMREFLKE